MLARGELQVFVLGKHKYKGTSQQRETKELAWDGGILIINPGVQALTLIAT